MYGNGIPKQSNLIQYPFELLSDSLPFYQLSLYTTDAKYSQIYTFFHYAICTANKLNITWILFPQAENEHKY